MRQITITCAGNSAVADSYNAGYQGEHNATAITYSLQDELINDSYTYITDMQMPDGTKISTLLNNYTLMLSASFTAMAGTISLQLTIKSGTTLVYKSAVVNLNIKQSLVINSTPTPSGSSIQLAEVNSDGHLIITLTDSTTLDAGYVVGPTGDKGDKGEPGSDYVLTDKDKQEIATVVTGDLSNKLDSKQDKLIAGKNIKTVNGESLLGEGNLAISSSAKLIGEATTSEMVSVIAVKLIEELQTNGVYVLQIYGGFNDQNMSLAGGTCQLRCRVRDSQRSIYLTTIDVAIPSKTIMNFADGMLFVPSKDYVAGQINCTAIRKQSESTYGENNAISFELVTEDRFWVKDTNIKIWRLI